MIGIVDTDLPRILVALVLLLAGCMAKREGPRVSTPRATAETNNVASRNQWRQRRQRDKRLVKRFVDRCRTCFTAVVRQEFDRAARWYERVDKPRIKRALKTIRRELLSCLTGRIYGNEPRVSRIQVETWLRLVSCTRFVKAAFNARHCGRIFGILEEVGFKPKPPGPPPRKGQRDCGVHGPLTPRSFNRIFRCHQPEIRRCYVNRGLSSNPKLRGIVRVRLSIGSSGRVVMTWVVSSTLKHRSTERCVNRTVRRWRFPKPKKKQIWYHRFHFTP